jgi:hypothetical protein
MKILIGLFLLLLQMFSCQAVHEPVRSGPAEIHLGEVEKDAKPAMVDTGAYTPVLPDTTSR